MRLSLRAKLGVVSLALLALPWVGYRYVQEMERFLLDAHRQSLLATAKAVATALHERPQLMRLSRPIASPQPPSAAAPADTAQDRGADPPGNALPTETARPGTTTGDGDSELMALLKGVERADARVWAVNRELKVLALAGSLSPSPESEAGPTKPWQRFLATMIESPARRFDDPLADELPAGGPEITAALLGGASSRVRNSRDELSVLVSAAQPIWYGDNVVGAVVAEATTDPILAVRNEALQRLLLTTLIVFAAVTAIVLGFATRLSNRIRQLRDEAESAIDTHGRIARLVTGSSAGDEIGDLSRSFSTILSRLAQHHGYLENLASRLSHELRTPVAVVRSSLENLRFQGVAPEGQIYLERADEGLTRLSRILSRMSEASRLEASLATQEREEYDLTRVVHDCVAAYRQVNPTTIFTLALPDAPATVLGSPDLAAQMLDKLVANAVDFTRTGEPIVLSIERRSGKIELRVSNKGPSLPAGMEGQQFKAMVSIRPETTGSGEGHLGLGLHVAQLIAHFHDASIRAENQPAGDGVSFIITLPLVTSV